LKIGHIYQIRGHPTDQAGLVRRKVDFLHSANPAALPWADRIGMTGTLVLWEDLDRLIDFTGSGDRSTVIDAKVDDAVRHLELVFHRYLAGEKASRKGERALMKVAIDINGRPLEPIDPFFRSHSATDCGPPEKIGVKDDEIHFQTFTLPHHSKVTPAEWERHAGRGGYVRNQGFYVYREKRLILHGTWFGLARQSELTKLARVRIDLTNKLDTYWKIDVKKASAQPPQVVRERLRRIIEQIGASSKRVYTARGKRLTDPTLLPVWCRAQSNEGITYGLNDDHPVVEEFRSALPDELKGSFERLLQTIGSALPMDALFADMAGDPEKVRGQAVADETLQNLVDVTVKGLRDATMSSETTIAMMRAAEPFRSNWERAEPLIMSRLKEHVA
jgi:hypothetical protein